MNTSIVMRARNDMPVIADTLHQLATQSLPFELVAFDNASTDGTREALRAATPLVHDVPAGRYIPGAVLNAGMSASHSEIVVFLNSDCVPVDDLWLAELLRPFDDPQVGAVFGRQMPRPGCAPLAARDIEDTFGDGSRQQRWRHCFSMASSAVRRSVWLQIPFDETLGYSEDIAWSFAVRNAGYRIAYAPGSRVFHSHNYSNQQWRQRQFGEGRAEARIFPWSGWQAGLLRYSLLPFARQLAADAGYCLRNQHWQALLAAPSFRFAQMRGRRAGLRLGLQERA